MSASPGWWTTAAAKEGQADELPHGHLNLGLSHGVPGPLALLSLAWREGVVVDGQREAVEGMMTLLTAWAVPVPSGLAWPGYLSLDHWRQGPGSAPAQRRPSWCYGAPGVSRAVQLAALAFDREDWHRLAQRSVEALLAEPPARWRVDDSCLCHGWSGLLHVLGRFADHWPDPRLRACADGLATLVLDAFDARLPFGYRTPDGTDLPAFLEGSAGIALALDAYAEGRVLGGWDEVLVVG